MSDPVAVGDELLFQPRGAGVIALPLVRPVTWSEVEVFCSEFSSRSIQITLVLWLFSVRLNVIGLLALASMILCFNDEIDLG